MVNTVTRLCLPKDFKPGNRGNIQVHRRVRGRGVPTEVPVKHMRWSEEEWGRAWTPDDPMCHHLKQEHALFIRVCWIFVFGLFRFTLFTSQAKVTWMNKLVYGIIKLVETRHIFLFSLFLSVHSTHEPQRPSLWRGSKLKSQNIFTNIYNFTLNYIPDWLLLLSKLQSSNSPVPGL